MPYMGGDFKSSSIWMVGEVAAHKVSRRQMYLSFDLLINKHIHISSLAENFLLRDHSDQRIVAA